MSEPNDSQKAIIEATEGIVLVDAGPGTGKTSTLVERYVNLLNKNESLNLISQKILHFGQASLSSSKYRLTQTTRAGAENSTAR